MTTAMAYNQDAAAGTGAGPVRKKLKTSDIPLPSTTRDAIQALTHTFKKKGGYDSLRKQVWEDLEKSDFESGFTKSLVTVAEDELEKNAAQLLKLDRGKAAALIEGAVDRAGVYQAAEAQIDALIDAHVADIETGIRALRKEDIGEEAAEAERARGGKSDEQYAEDAAKKREAREKVRREAREKELAIADEKRREDRVRRKEEERKLEAEREKRHAEREARRKAEREREEEKDKELRSRDRERDRDRPRDSDRHRDRDRDDRYRKNDEPTTRRDSTRDAKDTSVKTELSKEETERLEQEALNDLIKESKRLSQRSRHQMEVEIDETLAPPPRKNAPASAIKPISRDSPVNKPEIKIPTGPKADEIFKTPQLPADKHADRSQDRRRSRSHDRGFSRRSSRSRSRRRRDSRDRGDRRRDSREDRRRRSSRDRSRSPDRRRSYASPNREKSARDRSRDRVRPASPPPRDSDLEKWKVAEAKKREEQAKAWKAAQTEAREKGLPLPGWTDRTKDETPDRRIDDARVASPVSARKRDGSRDRERDRTSRARSRTPSGRRGSRIERSTSPVNIDRYVPGASVSRTSRRDSTVKRDRSRSRDRDREKDRDTRRSRDDEKPRRRSRSRSRSRRRDRDRTKARSRSRSPYARRERRDRSRSRDREKRRDRSRSRVRDRDRDRDRDRKRSRSRESRRDSKRE